VFDYTVGVRCPRPTGKLPLGAAEPPRGELRRIVRSPGLKHHPVPEEGSGGSTISRGTSQVEQIFWSVYSMRHNDRTGMSYSHC
jgi:hypothetical protein